MLITILTQLINPILKKKYSGKQEFWTSKNFQWHKKFDASWTMTSPLSQALIRLKWFHYIFWLCPIRNFILNRKQLYKMHYFKKPRRKICRIMVSWNWWPIKSYLLTCHLRFIYQAWKISSITAPQLCLSKFCLLQSLRNSILKILIKSDKKWTLIKLADYFHTLLEVISYLCWEIKSWGSRNIFGFTSCCCTFFRWVMMESCSADKGGYKSGDFV